MRADTLGPSASAEYLSGEMGWLLMQRPKVDDDLILLTNFGKAEAIVVEVLYNPATEEGVLLKVMTRGPSNKASKSGSSIVTDQKSAQLSRAYRSKPSAAK